MATTTSKSTTTVHDDPPPPSICISLCPRGDRTTLPQHASHTERTSRIATLTINQSLYRYQSPPTIPDIAFIKGPFSILPGQSPSLAFRLKVALVSLRIIANRFIIAGHRFRIFTHALPLLLQAAAADERHPHCLHQTISSFWHLTHPHVYTHAYSPEQREDLTTRFARARNAPTQFEEQSPLLTPYRSLFRTLSPPRVADNFLQDHVFVRLRVAGYNPMSLFRVRFLAHAPFLVDDYRMPRRGDTLASAVAEGRLFAVDFSDIASIAPKKHSQQSLVPAAALFALPPSPAAPRLAPVAIKLPHRIVYPPRRGSPAAFTAHWDIAKHIINACDAVHHELVAHLGRTHLLVEPFIAATMRQLAPEHPLHILLLPHFEGTVFINELASQQLIAPGGDVDRIFAGEIGSVMGWCAQRVINNRFNQSFPKVELDARGLYDTKLHFPYRDDALAHFEALREWVGGYLRHYYKSDDDVGEDDELYAWATELTDDRHGRVKDFGDDGCGYIRTVDYLIRAVTFLIFTASVQHAAVNFPQLSLMSYAPALAGALWGPLPRPEDHTDVLTWASLLPPAEAAMDQINILGVIGGVYYTRLGQYGKSYFKEGGACGSWPKPVRMAHDRYQRRLKEIDAVIVRGERGKDLKYDYLRPGKIPQSINIYREFMEILFSF